MFTSLAIWPIGTLMTIQNLRYKDYQLAARPAEIDLEKEPDAAQSNKTGLFESDTVKEFGYQMQQRGVYEWWRKAMGFTGQADRL